MKKISILLVALFLLAGLSFAQQRSVEEAAAIAAQFTNSQPSLSRAHKAPRKAANMRLVHTGIKLDSTEPAFYVFNQENNGGAVFVSADKRTEDILGYTESGQFDPENINPNLRFWLARYEEEMAILDQHPEAVLPSARKATKVTAIAPLLKNDKNQEIKWAQEAPYNNQCPIDKLDDTRSMTGCVATATAQIMYKWRWPIKGTGTKTYTWYDCTRFNSNLTKCYENEEIELSADYGATTYDWDNMLASYKNKSATTAQKNAVATLMYHVGVACEMTYGGDEAQGSGAWTDDMGLGLKTHLGYTFDKFITMYSKNEYAEAKTYDWNKKIKDIEGVTFEYEVTTNQIKAYFNADLEAGRPILMGGEDSQGGGHEFVCNGRDSNGKFYINWGWEDNSNGYFTLTSLGTDGYNFKNHIDALIVLRPRVENVNVKWYNNGVLFEETTAEGGVLALPTTNPTCEYGLTFVGWINQANYESETAPVYAKAGDQLEADATYYAVFVTAYDLYTTACVEIPQEPVQIRFFVNGEMVSDQTVALGGQPEVPAVTEGCDDYAFVGWWTAELDTENTAAKVWVSDFKARKAQDYYAVFTRTEENAGPALTNQFLKITTKDELTAANYLVVGSYSSNYYAMKNETTGTYYIAQQQVTPNGSTITNDDNSIIWKVAKSGNNVSFFNEAVNQYLYMYQNGTKYNLGLTNGTTDISFTPSVNDGVWDFISTTFSGQHIEYYGSKSDFCAYSRAGDPIYLYKQQEGSAAVTYYTTKPTCSSMDVETVITTPKAMKILLDGQVLIIRDGATFNLLGQPVR